MSRWVFNNARPVSRSHDMVERKYVLTRFSVEKVLSADEIVSAINSSVYIFGNSSLLHATSASNVLHGITRYARLPELGPLFHFCCQRWNSAVRRTSSARNCAYRCTAGCKSVYVYLLTNLGMIQARRQIASQWPVNLDSSSAIKESRNGI